MPKPPSLNRAYNLNLARQTKIQKLAKKRVPEKHPFKHIIFSKEFTHLTKLEALLDTLKEYSKRKELQQSLSSKKISADEISLLEKVITTVFLSTHTSSNSGKKNTPNMKKGKEIFKIMKELKEEAEITKGVYLSVLLTSLHPYLSVLQSALDKYYSRTFFSSHIINTKFKAKKSLKKQGEENFYANLRNSKNSLKFKEQQLANLFKNPHSEIIDILFLKEYFSYMQANFNSPASNVELNVFNLLKRIYLNNNIFRSALSQNIPKNHSLYKRLEKETHPSPLAFFHLLAKSYPKSLLSDFEKTFIETSHYKQPEPNFLNLRRYMEPVYAFFFLYLAQKRKLKAYTSALKEKNLNP